VLIDAFSQARKKVAGLRLVIVGAIHDGQLQYHRKLCEFAAQRGVVGDIVWVGKRKDVRPLLARFDVYVCSSLAESSPVSVWEAMAMGCPVVSTDVGDVSRHLTEGHSGYVVPVGDSAGLADRVIHLFDPDVSRVDFGRRARARAEAFAPAGIALQTERIYQAVIATRKNT